MAEYVHTGLNTDCYALAGYYTPLEEVRLKHRGREVLYVLGRAVIESSCCGSGSFDYVLVPGYIISWQASRSEAGLPVTEVEPIAKKSDQDEIRKIISERAHNLNVQFW